jgi:spore germination protein GerM
LLAPADSTVDTVSPAPTASAKIYFVRATGRLSGVPRTVASPATLGSALASLVQGVNDQEAAAGLRSAINPQTQILGAQVNNGVAIINVSEAFSGASVPDQIFALGQLVFTATSLPGVSAVSISLNSNPVEVPRGDGSRTNAVLTQADYASLAPGPGE